MAESILVHLIEQNKIVGIETDSAATHTDELGNPPHRGTRAKLGAVGIPLVPHRARLMSAADGENFDLLIGMDGENVRDMRRIVGRKNEGKVKMLLDFTPHPRAVADPWYTGDFEATYSDILKGCKALLRSLGYRDIK